MEVTTRTIHGRFLLAPYEELNDLILGALGRAQELYPSDSSPSPSPPVTITFYSASRLEDWREKFWFRRFQAIPISDEPQAQIERLEYVLSHGCKEGLVEHLREWPGVSVIAALLNDAPLVGHWFNRSREYAAASAAGLSTASTSRPSTTCGSSPCPAGRTSIPSRAAALREATGRPVLGPEAIRAQKRHNRPAKPKKSPAPLVHAASKKIRLELYRAYGEFLGAFRVAAGKLRAGAREVTFRALTGLTHTRLASG